MKFNAYIAGVGMTHFGKHMEAGLKALGGEAVRAALDDAGVAAGDLEAAWVGQARKCRGGIDQLTILGHQETGPDRCICRLLNGCHIGPVVGVQS